MDMWGSILGAVALGSQEISEYTGSADEKRALVVVAVLVIGFLIFKKKK